MFNFAYIRHALSLALHEAIDLASKRINEIVNAKQVVNGISFDLYPWHSYVAISFRDAESFYKGFHFNSADWKHFEVVASKTTDSPALSAAAKMIDYEWNNANASGLALNEAAHLIFLAGAESLLDGAVAKQLYALGLMTNGVLADRFGTQGPFFEYMVFDADQTIRANYCEIVLANRATKRLLDQLTKLENSK